MSNHVEYLDLQTVIAINEQMVLRFGEVIGIRDAGLLESAIAQPMQSFGGLDAYPSIPGKAARLAFGIIKNHPFVDGNKRTAAASIAAFLEINGRSFDPPKGELANTIISLAAGEIDWDDFKEWVARHVRGRA